jgi:hypothetical protein
MCLGLILYSPTLPLSHTLSIPLLVKMFTDQIIISLFTENPKSSPPISEIGAA